MSIKEKYAIEFIKLLRDNKHIEQVIKECVIKTLNQSSQRSS